VLASGEERAGADLRAIVEEARLVRQTLASAAFALRPRHRAGRHRRRAEPDRPDEEPTAQALADDVARRLDAISDETERGWQASVENGGYIFAREVRGVRQAACSTPALLASADARRLDEHAESPARGLRRAGDASPQGDEKQAAGPSPRCSTPSRPPAARASASASATRASAR
jgi:DNA gyrase subunit B